MTIAGLQLILISSVDYTVPEKVAAALHQEADSTPAKPALPEAAMKEGGMQGHVPAHTKDGHIAIGALCNLYPARHRRNNGLSVSHMSSWWPCHGRCMQIPMHSQLLTAVCVLVGSGSRVRAQICLRSLTAPALQLTNVRLVH